MMAEIKTENPNGASKTPHQKNCVFLMMNLDLVILLLYSFRLRHISKNSAKDESDQTIQVEPKPAIKIPAKVKNLPPQAGFCLECEHCTAKNCDHLTHSRKIFDDLACHARDSGHKRFQLASILVLPQLLKLISLLCVIVE
jgi:hypothetical protein